MKKGDMVKFHDGSYTLIYDENKGLVSTSGTHLIAEGIFEVLAVGCKLPSTQHCEFNNIIVIGVESRILVFAQAQMVSTVHGCHNITCPNCGEVITRKN